MLRAIAVDDESIALVRFAQIVQKEGSFQLEGAFDNPGAAIEFVKNHEIEAAFLDIDMPVMNGLVLAERLVEINPAIHIIFSTAYDQYALQAFRVNATGYLLKPIALEDLRREAEKIKSKWQKTVHPEQVLMVQCFDKFVFYGSKSPEKPLAFRTAKAEELMAFLVHNKGKPVHRDAIMDVLWMDMNNERALNNFYVTCSYVRNVLNESGLGDMFVSSRRGHFLKIEKIRCDLYTYMNLLDELKACQYKRVDLLEQASSAYTGGYLAQQGYTWAQDMKGYFEREFTKIQLLLFEHYRSHQEISNAEEALTDLLKRNPLCEEAYESLVELYLSSDNKAMAIRAYHQMERVLRDELGVDPSLYIQQQVKKLRYPGLR